MIDVNKITERQILTIQNGINMYTYIQNHWKDNDDDFRDVFTDYYLRSQPVMRREENRKIFFGKLKDDLKDKCLIKLVEELYKELPIHPPKYEFSFATKLLHTVDNESPIYDSKVREYLKKNHDAVFLFNSGKSGEKTELIKHDWSELTKWYEGFLKDEMSKEWINWFDKTFPSAKWISSVKKVDFIIFACN